MRKKRALPGRGARSKAMKARNLCPLQHGASVGVVRSPIRTASVRTGASATELTVVARLEDQGISGAAWATDGACRPCSLRTSM